MNFANRSGLALAALAALSLGAAHPAAAQSSLSGTSRTVDSSVTVNLTAEGIVDWTKYSQSAGGSPVTYRKAGATGITLTGTAGPQTYSDVGNDAPSFTWTDGAAPNGSGADGSEYYYGQAGGLETGSFTVQSSSLAGGNVFSLYTGCYNGGATVTSKLYDENGVVLRTFSDTFSAPQGANDYAEYTFAYTGGSYLATTVTSTDLYGGGFHTVNLQAATLSTPEPSSVAAFAATGLGMAGLVFKARRRAAVA